MFWSSAVARWQSRRMIRSSGVRLFPHNVALVLGQMNYGFLLSVTIGKERCCAINRESPLGFRSLHLGIVFWRAMSSLLLAIIRTAKVSICTP